MQLARRLILGTVAFFFVATAYFLYLVIAQQESIRNVARYNAAWIASQMMNEVARFSQRVAEHQIPGKADADEVQLRFDIVLSRMEVLKVGEFHDLIASDPGLQATVRSVADAIASIEPLVDRIAEPGVAARIGAILLPLEQPLAALASASYRRGGEFATRDQQRLVELNRVFLAFGGGLILFGIGLIGALSWNNRLLRRAHRELARRDAMLRTQNRRFDAALNNMRHGLCMVDREQRLIVCNDPFLSMFGGDRARAVAGIALRDLFATKIGSGSGVDRLFEQLLADQGSFVAERRPGRFVHETIDGRAISVAHEPMSDGGWVATYEDISERRQVEARIDHMAHHDSLTDLANRVLLRERLDHALGRLGQGSAVSASAGFALLCVDLDQFKQVNDAFGHPAGDELLRMVARRLRATVDDKDTIARLGSDEFAVLRLVADQPRDASALAARILDALRRPFGIEGQEIAIGASVGITTAPHDGREATELLRNAEIALYRAKAEGRNTYRFFEAEMDRQLQERRVLEADLREALARDQFQVYYQPFVDAKSGKVVGFEALIRWIHPVRGIVSPGLFIPIAEETGLIVAIGEWVLRQACADAATWPGDIKVAVNLSPVQLRTARINDVVVQALAAAGLAPHRLEVEITESLLMQDDAATVQLMEQMRTLGVRVSLDDFGTGYSSLSYLRSFPFDKIKIDQSFIRELSTRPDCVAIVASVARLAGDLGMRTTAEGVETAGQADVLRALGVSELQGYHIARPQPYAEATKLLWSMNGPKASAAA